MKIRLADSDDIPCLIEKFTIARTYQKIQSRCSVLLIIRRIPVCMN